MRCLSRFAVLVVAGALLGCAPVLRAEPLVTNFGIGTLLHPVEEPEHVPLPSCYQNGPCHCCKERVHVFAINGLNPLCLGNFNGLCTYLRKQGFEHTHFGQLYGSCWFTDEIRHIRSTDPDARIVLIGFSLGANYVKCMANHLNKEGIKVDLLVYLVGDFVFNTPSSHPPNVVRVVNIRAKGLVLTGGDLMCNGADIDGACNHRLSCRHILVPSRRETLALLMEELLTLACEPCAR